jgi:hypothetical protein
MRLRRPKHGTVIAYVALFAALGGTSYAAASLPRNSVGTSQIRNNAVTSSKIANNAVSSAQVRNGSLTSSDFKAGTLLTGPAGAPGAPGPQGPAGGGAAIGFANVSQAGVPDPGTSVGIGAANIIHNVQGGYCFTGLPGTMHNVQVTAQNGFNGAVIGNATLGVFGQCPLGTQVSVVLLSASTGAAVNNGFFISID